MTKIKKTLRGEGRTNGCTEPGDGAWVLSRERVEPGR